MSSENIATEVKSTEVKSTEVESTEVKQKDFAVGEIIAIAGKNGLRFGVIKNIAKGEFSPWMVNTQGVLAESSGQPLDVVTGLAKPRYHSGSGKDLAVRQALHLTPEQAEAAKIVMELEKSAIADLSTLAERQATQAKTERLARYASLPDALRLSNVGKAKSDSWAVKVTKATDGFTAFARFDAGEFAPAYTAEVTLPTIGEAIGAAVLGCEKQAKS